MAAYQAALATAPTEIGISRSKPGSVAAAVAALFGSERSFGSKAAGTRDKYRAVLESFRNDLGETPWDRCHENSSWRFSTRNQLTRRGLG
jgi:hypothetical protein